MSESKSSRPGAFEFVGEWLDIVMSLPESGMGYTVARVTLRDGRVFEQVLIDSGILARIRKLQDVPFVERDIASIVATHDKWDWKEVP